MLNDKLRAINVTLRQQARAGVVYAPGLSYAPAKKESVSYGPGPDSGMGPTALNASGGAAAALVAPAASAAAPSSATPAALSSTAQWSMDEEERMSGSQRACMDALKEGKRLLKEGSGPPARVRFEKALMLAKSLEDKVAERRAVRGLAAASRLQGQYKVAIKYLKRVLQISKEIGEHTGDSDAYGTIADIYTDIGDLDKAAKYYDEYIARLNTDGPV